MNVEGAESRGMASRFEGRVVYVTGAGSGIGRATAELFATEGAKVFVVDLDGEAVTDVVDRIRSAGGTAVGGVCDVASFESVEASVEYAVLELGGLGILPNAAGVGRAARLEEIDEREWSRTIAVNLTGVFHTTKASIPHLLKAPRPAVVNVASVAGLRRQAYSSPYTASKAGMIA